MANIFIFPWLPWAFIAAIIINKRIGRILSLRFIPVKTKRGSILIHASSVGELNGIRPLLQKLKKKRKQFFLSLFTDTAFTRASEDWKNIPLSAAPLDLPFSVLFFLLYTRPSRILIVETELWPGLILTARILNIPMIMVNARLSEKKETVYRKFHNSFSTLLGCFFRILVQDQASLKRFQSINPEAPYVLTGTTKFDIMSSMSFPAGNKKKWVNRLGLKNKLVITAGCARGMEPELLIKAMKSAHRKACLIIAPRYPEQIEEIKTLLKSQKLPWSILSQGIKKDSRIIVADRLGILLDLYHVSQIAFIGGTLEPIGGHNPLEAAAAECAIIHGPSISNNEGSFLLLKNSSAAIQVSGKTLSSAINKLIRSPSLRKQFATKALNVLKKQDSVTEKIFNEIF